MSAEQLTLLLNLAISVFLPTLVGLITTRAMGPSTRAILLLVLAFAQTLVGQILLGVGDGNFDWFTWIATGIASFVVGVAMHFGFWKPTGVSHALVSVGSGNTAVER